METYETEIRTLDEYMAIILSRFKNLKPNAFYEKKRIFFRGQSDSNYTLLPSIARVMSGTETYIRFEGNMIETAKLQNPEDFANIVFPINMLAKMQHYGLPTRLLDVTENALIALFFACNEHRNKPGEVFCFVVDQKEVRSSYSLSANIAAYLYNEPFSFVNLKDYVTKIKYESFFPRAERETSTERIVEYIINQLSRPLFVLPEMLSEREKRQQAAFVVFPNDLTIEKDPLESYFNDEISDIKTTRKPEINTIISVHAKSKRTLLRQLELFGISEHFLFPEIERKCKAIKMQTINLVDEKHNT